MLVPGTGADCTPEACGRSREPERQLKEVVSLRRVSSRGYLNASLTIPATKSRGKVAAMKSMSTRRRTLVLASSLALLSSLGLWATAVEAWWTPPPSLSCGSSTFPATGQITPATGTMTHTGATVRDDGFVKRSEEHTSELQSLAYLVCRLLLEKKKKKMNRRKSLCARAIRDD